MDEDPDSNLCELHRLFWGKLESSLYHTFKVKIPHHMTLEIEEGEGSDFTVIKLPAGVKFPFGGSMMLVPEIYQTFWDLVESDDVDWQSRQERDQPFHFPTHATIIIGQPGIGQQCFFRLLCLALNVNYHTGKSVWENYILIRRLQRKMVTIFCDHASFAHVFSSAGVRRVVLADVWSIPELDNDSNCTALINICTDLAQPPSHFSPKNRKGRVVVAISPNVEHWKSFTKERAAGIYCMPTCDWDDLFCSW